MQNYVIVGTAGHVDHGKTTLIKALTDISTDRLGEEQKRGITIELGFAYMIGEDERKIGIIDVPGHEKFVKHMLAGIGGIDIALIVVDANEGVMPQTKEHIYIMELLGIKEGIIAITKADTVDSDWLDIVEDDIKNFVAGSFLEDANIHFVSSHTGQGINELRAEIFEKASTINLRDLGMSSRLFVDRVFTLKGTGTVITGTLFNGEIKVGDNLSLYPEEFPCKVRNLQVHEEDVEIAHAGQRLAVNLTGIKKEDIKRGFVLAEEDSLLNTNSIFVDYSMIPESKKLVKHGSPIHFHSGSNSVIGHIYFFDRKELREGERAFAQIKFSENIALKYKDKFILRYFSPLDTVGGGEILHVKPRRKKEKDILEKLQVLRDGSYEEVIMEFIEEFSYEFKDFDFYKKMLNLNNEDYSKLIKSLEQVVIVNSNIPIYLDYYGKLREKTLAMLEDYHKTNPLKHGMPIPEVHNKILPNIDEKIAAGLMDTMIKSGDLLKTDVYSLATFESKMDTSQEEFASQIEELLSSTMLMTKEEVLENLGREKEPILEAMIKEGKIIRLTPQVLIHISKYNGVIDMLKEHFESNDGISLGEFRDKTSSSRKIALCILEYLDNKKITIKNGDVRTLNHKKIQ